jgi:hypothetical protein
LPNGEERRKKIVEHRCIRSLLNPASMEPPSNTDAALESLAALLRRRLEVIADHRWRDADPDAHFEAIKTVSLEIGSAHQSLAGQLPARLEHFLIQCSFDKALAYIESGDTGH